MIKIDFCCCLEISHNQFELNLVSHFKHNKGLTNDNNDNIFFGWIACLVENFFKRQNFNKMIIRLIRIFRLLLFYEEKKKSQTRFFWNHKCFCHFMLLLSILFVNFFS